MPHHADEDGAVADPPAKEGAGDEGDVALAAAVPAEAASAGDANIVSDGDKALADETVPAETTIAVPREEALAE